MLDIATKLVQIAFWITAGTVAVLTFLSARKTLLQPIRTEVFKLQLAGVQEVLACFVGKMEADLQHDFGIFATIAAYVDTLMFEYIRVAFGMQLSEKREFNITKSTAEYPHTWPDCLEEKRLFCSEFKDAHSKITALLENPLLPTELVRLIEEFLKAMFANAKAINDAAWELSRDMPQLFPDMESIHREYHDIAFSRCDARTEELKPKADAIVAYIRREFDVDHLLNAPLRKRRPNIV